jgi:hypothetical protein
MGVIFGLALMAVGGLLIYIGKVVDHYWPAYMAGFGVGALGLIILFA